MPKQPQILDALFPSVFQSDLKKSEGKGVRYIMDDEERAEAKAGKSKEKPTLVKSIINILNGPNGSIERLAFDEDPTQNNIYSSVYKQKHRLLPDSLLKRIAIQDDLVASIVQTRTNHISSFGRPRPDRFSTGYDIEPNVGVVEKLDAEKKAELHRRIEAAVEKIRTCGETKGWDDENRCNFSTYLSMSTRNAIVVGRLATEIIYVKDAQNGGEKKFHSFRAIDAGTIYKAAPQQTALQSVRDSAKALLEQLKNEKFIPEKFVNNEYSWVQVIEGQPRQAFTSEECVVHNFYPVPDVEMNGYPVTPLDTIITAVTTHINITTHNKLYFQSGRATRGMLLIKSDDVDETVVARVKQQFNASINSVGNSWRMPVFAVGTGDDISWQPIDSSGSRDMEFQYLTDMNARIIMSAFQMSPEELAGWAYLSRGTANQALSESNKEYQLEAARDTGIRPLISQFEDFLNDAIFPLIDPVLAKICRLKLVGLDAETAEKESVRLQQDLPIHMTFDQILQKVEKEPVGREFAGEFPLNVQFGAVLDKYFTVGQILERFMGVKGAAKDPSLQYFRDPFWFQFQQLVQQSQMAQQQAQQLQGAPGDDTGGGPPDGGGSGGGGAPDMDAQTDAQKEDIAKQSQAGNPKGPDGTDLARSISQAMDLLTKSEIPPGKKKLLHQHQRVVDQALDSWKNELRIATAEIVKIAEGHLPTKKK